MARNQEKQIAELNRFVIAKEKDHFKERTRPPLDKLKTPESIRKWIPVIKKEIDYCIQQIEGNRNYTEAKIREFQQRLDELEQEYKDFVAKSIDLDDNPMWLPGEDHSYVSKTTFQSTKDARKSGEVMVNFNESEGNQHSAVNRKRPMIPEFLQPILAEKTNTIRKEESILGQEFTSSEDEEIETPLAIPSKVMKASDMDSVASNNTTNLQRSFNSHCVKYYSRSH